MDGPHIGKNRNPFPYGLPPNYTPPNIEHMPTENANHFVPIEGQWGKPVKSLGIML